MDKKGKIRLADVSSFIRHKTKKDMFEITTRTGRKIKVTGDHSLFHLDKEGKVAPVKCCSLKIDDYLAVPRYLPFENSHAEAVDILDFIDKDDDVYIQGDSVRNFVRNNRSAIRRFGSKSNLQHWSRGILPLKIARKIGGSELEKGVKIKFGKNSKSMPRIIPLNKNILEFFGLWLADGCYDKNEVIISVVDDDSRNVVRSVAAELEIKITMHTDGISLILHSGTLKRMMKCLGFDGNAYTKHIPEWTFGLSKEQTAHFLRGVFSGDGYITNSEVAISLASKDIIKGIQSMLLTFGIISRINRMGKDMTYSCRISQLDSIRKFIPIGFLQQNRIQKLSWMCRKTSTHDSTDVVPLSKDIKSEIHKLHENFNYHDYVVRDNNIGRNKLLSITKAMNVSALAENLCFLAESDIFWDQIREIRRTENSEEWVYDFSVPECENFVCENIIAHNTLELPFDQLRDLGYNIERLKSRSVITHVETELPAEEALRTALRLGDSALIVGEIRSKEALALYEAMRIGALANMVAGTIHGDSAYGVFDRVVNDLGVTPTSFKATDIVLVANMLRSPEGLRAFRRVVEITEVRKHWKHDPAEESGFVNLFEYSAREDALKPSKTLLMGESQVLNDISMRIREWKGNWNAVWNNIRLRARILQSIVDYSLIKNRPDILEADFVVASNSMFHVISSEVKEETGEFDNDEIFERWNNWMKRQVP
jgi:intein/homing endonuclease